MNESRCNIDFSSGKAFLTTMYTSVFLLGVPLNCAVLWSIAQQLRTNKILAVYVVNLLVADLLQLTAMPFGIIYILQNHQWMLGHVACVFVHFIFFINLFAIVIFTAWISMVRYMAISHPLSFRSLQTIKCSCIISATLWLLSIFIYIVGDVVRAPAKNGTLVCFEVHPIGYNQAACRLVLSVVFYFLPCLLQATLSLLIVKSLGGSSSVGAGERKRITALLALITVGLTLVIGPYHGISSFRYVATLLNEDSCPMERALFLPYQVAFAVVNLRVVLVPVFYLSTSSDMQSRLRVCLGCCGTPL